MFFIFIYLLFFLHVFIRFLSSLIIFLLDLLDLLLLDLVDLLDLASPPAPSLSPYDRTGPSTPASLLFLPPNQSLKTPS